MGKDQLLDLLENDLGSFLKDFGFELKQKSKAFEKIEFRKETLNGADGVIIGVTTINSKHKLNYSVYKEFKEVQRILSEVKGSFVGLNWTKDDRDFAASYESLNGINRITTLPKVVFKDDLLNNIETIKSYLESTLFPLLAESNDLNSINDKINGVEFWDTDWRKPFNLGGNFEYKRLIFAHLCDLENGVFNEIAQKQKVYLQSKCEGEYAKDFEEVISNQQILVDYLRKV